MDAEIINTIRDAVASINKAFIGRRDLFMEYGPYISVKSYDDINEIAEIMYGSEGWRKVSEDHHGGWTTAHVKSPEGIVFSYNNYSLDDAVFHIAKCEFLDDGSTVTTTETVKAVD